MQDDSAPGRFASSKYQPAGRHAAAASPLVRSGFSRCPRGDLHLTPLYDEPRVLLVGEDHPLAGRTSVSVHELGTDPMPRVEDQAWNAFWRIDPRPDGSPAPDGPLVRVLEDKLELVAAGEAIAVVAAGEHDGTLRPDLVVVPLRDAEPSQVVLATRADEARPLVVAFRAVARAVLTGPVPPPP